MVPGGPVFGVGVTAPAAALTGSGIVIEEIETNSAEVSSSTKNTELELRVANSKHATMNSYARLFNVTCVGQNYTSVQTAWPFTLRITASELGYPRIVFFMSTNPLGFQTGVQ